MAHRRVYAPQHIRHLPSVPNASVERRKRVMGARAGCRQHPFLKDNLRRTSDDRALRPRFFREILRQIFDKNGQLLIGHLRASVVHHVDDCPPVLRVVASSEHATKLVASGALALHDFSTSALGQIGLAVGGCADAEQKRDEVVREERALTVGTADGVRRV